MVNNTYILYELKFVQNVSIYIGINVDISVST